PETRRLRSHAHPDLVLARRGHALQGSGHRRAQPRHRADGDRSRCRADSGPRSGRGVRVSTSTNTAGRHGLECTAAAKAYQKAFGTELKARVVERGEPFAVAQADTPHEIFHAMDIPIVSNQWWSA